MSWFDSRELRKLSDGEIERLIMILRDRGDIFKAQYLQGYLHRRREYRIRKLWKKYREGLERQKEEMMKMGLLCFKDNKVCVNLGLFITGYYCAEVRTPRIFLKPEKCKEIWSHLGGVRYTDGTRFKIPFKDFRMMADHLGHERMMNEVSKEVEIHTTSETV